MNGILRGTRCSKRGDCRSRFCHDPDPAARVILVIKNGLAVARLRGLFSASLTDSPGAQPTTLRNPARRRAWVPSDEFSVFVTP